MSTKLPYIVECRFGRPFFEVIAAFNCESAAKGYATDCQVANEALDYRVVKAGIARAKNTRVLFDEIYITGAAIIQKQLGAEHA